MKSLLHKISYLLLCSTTSVAAETSSPLTFSGEVAAKFIHNSALSVEELDNVSSQSDSGHQLNASLGGKWQVSEAAKLAANYSYQQQTYNEASQYDLALHQFNVDGSYQFNDYQLGARIDAANARLAGDTFLDFQQVSVYLGHFILPQTFVRPSVKVKNKSFAQLTDRDATGFGASVDIFHFMNDARTMLMLGLNADKEDAQDPQYDHRAIGFTTKVTHKFDLFGLDSNLGLVWRYQKEDYQTVTSASLTESTELERDETKRVVQANLGVLIMDNLTLETKFEHGDYRSALEGQTYQQNIASVGLSYAF
ncbi:hypothetical protein [Aliiglaciecola litoralis]|uniref:Uncharacterized protein n=1 Tax=Aliiglaciecola litoralis TaxID=582857 RepID=A0ABN1LTD4_9ALTE